MHYRQEFFNLEKNFSSNQKNLKDLKKTHSRILDDLRKGKLECISIVNNRNEVELVNQVSEKLKKYKNIIFLGTGGSSLGGKTLHSINENQYIKTNKPNIYFIENIDSEQIKELLESINLNETFFIVVSKSGETIETLCQFFFVKNFFSISKKKLSKRVLIITENKKSTLKLIQEELDCLYLEHNKKIGGRYSIFSLVGMLPAELSNLNISKIIKGGSKVLKEMTRLKNVSNFYPAIASLNNYNLINNGIKQNIFMPYSDSLVNFSMWYRQLWGESVGKKGFGSTPVNALGTVDQHSQLQLYLDGPKDKFITIINFINKRKTLVLDCSITKTFFCQSLHKKTMNDLIDAEKEATIHTLKKKDIPLRIIELESKSEEAIGELLMHFFLETIYTCYLFGVNPFDQPAVEEVKKLAFKYLKHEKDKTVI